VRLLLSRKVGMGMGTGSRSRPALLSQGYDGYEGL
jgi:hypothetical protein